MGDSVKYLALPFVLALGILEFVLRVLAVLLLVVSILGMFVLAETDLDALLRPVCFKLAERIVA